MVEARADEAGRERAWGPWFGVVGGTANDRSLAASAKAGLAAASAMLESVRVGLADVGEVRDGSQTRPWVMGMSLDAVGCGAHGLPPAFSDSLLASQR